jgi:hypothetical protein
MFELSKKSKKHEAYTYYMLLHEREIDSTHHEEEKSYLEITNINKILNMIYIILNK